MASANQTQPHLLFQVGQQLAKNCFPSVFPTLSYLQLCHLSLRLAPESLPVPLPTPPMPLLIVFNNPCCLMTQSAQCDCSSFSFTDTYIVVHAFPSFQALLDSSVPRKQRSNKNRFVFPDENLSLTFHCLMVSTLHNMADTHDTYVLLQLSLAWFLVGFQDHLRAVACVFSLLFSALFPVVPRTHFRTEFQFAS